MFELILTVTLNESLEQDPPDVPIVTIGAVVDGTDSSDVEGPRMLKDSKSRRR